MDSSDDIYSRITVASSSPASCAQACGKFPSPNLVGFTYFGNLGFPYDCYCHYSGVLPAPPSGSGWKEIRTDYPGSGPIKGSQGTTGFECYAFPQVSKPTYDSPSSFAAPLIAFHCLVICCYRAREVQLRHPVPSRIRLSVDLNIIMYAWGKKAVKC